MKILSTSINNSFTIKKSKFICFGYFINSKEEAKSIINIIKKQYPDASHICYAYILDDKSYYYTDGGEPSGTAGKPIYGALLSLKLNYTLCVVVRYFGGIKFGPGPLRSTFKDVALQTLSKAKTKISEIKDVVLIKIPYSQIKIITNTFKTSIINKQYDKEFVLIDLAGQKENLIKQLQSLKIKPIKIKENQVV